MAGPFIVVPAKQLIIENGKTFEQMEYFYFLPEKLNISGEVLPEKRYRGIYEVVVYQSKLNVSGVFAKPDFTEWKSENHTILWGDAFLAMGITDMRGIKNAVACTWNGKQYQFNPSTVTHDVVESGVSAKVPLYELAETDTSFSFSFVLNLNGSKTLHFAPFGKETSISLQSSWSEPSFSGAFLPDKREVNDKGFTSSWNVIHLNRNYPQSWRNTAYTIKESYFGVDLIVPVDHYLKSMRSAKYAILIISLTFIVYFFIELLGKIRVHPFQYILVGLAICIFYSLLLSFSEHMNFDGAYILSGLLVISAISLYSRSIFKKPMPSILLSLILILIYGFIYVIIQLQDYALLVGSIGLFLVLVTIMYLSQKVKWYRTE
jgi:inner membrane protein